MIIKKRLQKSIHYIIYLGCQNVYYFQDSMIRAIISKTLLKRVPVSQTKQHQFAHSQQNLLKTCIQDRQYILEDLLYNFHNRLLLSNSFYPIKSYPLYKFNKFHFSDRKISNINSQFIRNNNQEQTSKAPNDSLQKNNIQPKDKIKDHSINRQQSANTSISSQIRQFQIMVNSLPTRMRFFIIFLLFSSGFIFLKTIVDYLFKIYSQIKKQWDDKKMKQQFLNSFLNKQSVKKGVHQIDDKQLEEQILDIVHREEINSTQSMHLIAGFEGIGKTTTVKKIVRQLRQKQQYKDKVYYFSFQERDKRNKEGSGNKLGNKKAQLINLLQQIPVSQQITIKDQQKDRIRKIIPIIFVDDIHLLQDLQNENKKQMSWYFRSLITLANRGIRIISISDSVLFYKKLKGKISNYQQTICNCSLLRPLKQEIKKQMLGAITYKHLNNLQYKSLFEKSKPQDLQKIQEFIKQEYGFLPQQANINLMQTLDQLNCKVAKNSTNIVDLVIKKLKQKKEGHNLRFSRQAIDQLSKRKLFEQNKQIIYRSFQKISQLNVNTFQLSSCRKVIKEVQRQYIRLSMSMRKQLKDIFDSFQKLKILNYCHPRSEFMKEVIDDIKQDLKPRNRN